MNSMVFTYVFHHFGLVSAGCLTGQTARDSQLHKFPTKIEALNQRQPRVIVSRQRSWVRVIRCTGNVSWTCANTPAVVKHTVCIPKVDSQETASDGSEPPSGEW